MRVEVRGEGEERLEEVRAWMVEREGVVERAGGSLPDPSMVAIDTYVELLCGLLDIPVYNSKVTNCPAKTSKSVEKFSKPKSHSCVVGKD